MTQIYVGNIPYGKNENDLKDLFGQYGEVSSVKFVNDKETGRFRGFGFVEMVNSDEANKAITALEGNDFGGRTLRVNEARPRAPRPPREPRW
ncbi:MAG: RNA-binding protein [Sulfuricurvum sp.]|uniref:RNA recognition motif domain-containing protein n=1 Tax=Sulfuricurvum sp. TaxID=2025608 RepID=UPI0026271B00|nr:RNA-binding protein [Sulfuricurvum sp.]MDD2829357.1 RNA-binding protein [Sulfuricurvum sp.]MDD4949151.1 RNA-binding protein [Sulfuricurvum sp.]